MSERQPFKAKEFRRNNTDTFGRMKATTLRVTGLERVFEEVNSRNRSVLRNMNVACESIIKSPEAIWDMVKRNGYQGHPDAVPVIGMSLGDPSAYGDFPPNPTMEACLQEVCSEVSFAELCRYTNSYGVPELSEYLKRANMSDPASVNKEPGKFKDVVVVLTAGGSLAAPYAMDPMLNPENPEHTVAVHDWIYIIHLGAAYYKNAHVVNFDLRDDGVPDPDSLARTLDESLQNGKKIQFVVCTTIGNPIGSAMPEETLIKIMRVVQDHAEKAGRPVVLLLDTAYEAFRADGKPLDPIEIAIDNGLELPVGVCETASKGHGLCGWRLGALRMWWPSHYFARERVDYLDCLNSKVQPTLCVNSMLTQLMFLRYLKKMETDSELRQQNLMFLADRRKRANANLMVIAQGLREIDGIYHARYYNHSGRLDMIDPTTLSSFYFTFGFHGLTKYGSEHNQARAFGEFCLEHGLPVINAVPGFSFLPKERLSAHPGLIRVTGLTGKEDTEAFLRSAAEAAAFFSKAA